MEKCCVYKISFIGCSDFYIGGTKRYESRIRNHLSQLKNKKHHNRHLQKISNSFGIENILIEILEEVDMEFIEDREQYYLSLFKPKINISLDRKNKGRKATKSERKKLSKSHLGIKPTKENLLKRSISMINKLSSLSSDDKEKRMSAARLAHKKLHRKVVCINTGIVYNTISEAERKTGADNISAICKGQRNHSLGLKFKYLD